MKRVLLKTTLVLSLWLVCLAFALEAWVRFTEWKLDRRVPEVEVYYGYNAPKCARNAEILREVLGTDQVVFNRDQLAWQELLKSPDLEPWQRRADEHGEVFLFLDRDWKIHTRVVPRNVSDELAVYAARLEPGRRLETVLPQGTVQDAAQCLEIVSDSFWQFREYPVPLPRPYRVTVFQFGFLRMDAPPAAPDLRNGYLVVVRLSIWLDFLFALRPGVKRASGSIEEISSQGWRSDEVAVPKPPGVFRIICVGGSTTYEGDHNALTWPALLQRRLRAETGRPIEVVNAGILALDSFGESQHAEDYLAVEPDLVLHYNFVNDMERIVSALNSDGTSSGLVKAALRRMAGISVLLRRRLDAYLLWDKSQVDRALDLTFSNYDFLRNAVHRAGARMAFCTFARPDPDISPAERALIEQRLRAQYWGQNLTLLQYCWIVDCYNDRLRRYCAEHQLPLLDIAPYLTGGADRYIDYCHMRPWSIEEKARLVAERILPLLGETQPPADASAAARTP
ncbi:MAG TPA: hypothetical protein PLX03_00275 [Candidatus Hydrogenedentes bacterium]|nr:hypothetical protein [Candidatus Hydrogenedentota bacterium]